MPRPAALRRVLSASLALGAALAVAGPALGAGWMPAAPISPSGHSTSTARVGFDGQGRAVAHWTQDAAGSNGMAEEVGAATWMPGTGWTTIPGHAALDDSSWRTSVVDGQGTLYAISFGQEGYYGVGIQESSVQSGQWLPAENVANGDPGVPGYSGTSFRGFIGVGYNGAACVLYGGDNGAARAASRPPGVPWSEVASTAGLSSLKVRSSPTQVSMVANSTGCASAAWWGTDDATIRIADFASGSGVWRDYPRGPLTAGGTLAADPILRSDQAGNQTLIWTAIRPETVPGQSTQVPIRHLYVSQRPAGGDWSDRQAPRRLSPFVHDAYVPHLAVSRGGAAIAAWVHAHQVFATIKQPGSDWGAVLPLSAPAPTDARDVEVAVGDGGVAAAVWTQVSGTERVPFAAIYRDGAWGPAAALSGREGMLNAAEIGVDVTPQGDAIVVWSNGGVRARVYDGSGPSLAPVQGATAGYRGDAVTFRTSASDSISGLSGGTLWTFGDGTWATGDEVSHRYDAAGTYTVTAEARDNQGNITRRTHAVTVSNPPAPAPPAPPAPPSPGAPSGTGPGPAQVQGAPATVRLAGAMVISQTWRGRTLRASVQTPLTVTSPQKATVSVRAIGGVAVRLDPGIRGRQVLARRVVLKTGAIRLVTVLPPNLDPGRYQLAIAGAEGATVSQTVVIGNPEVGILAGSPRVASSSHRNGFVSARFRWAVKPSARARITAQWVAPAGSGLKFGQESRARAATTFSRLRGTMPKGQWRCILRVNGVVMAVARTRV